jgi:hypothetical protein
MANDLVATLSLRKKIKSSGILIHFITLEEKKIISAAVNYFLSPINREALIIFFAKSTYFKYEK